MRRLITIVCLVGLILAMVSPAMASGTTVHIVQAGQTLYSIARLYGTNYSTLAQMNGIVNPNQIYVGQQLVIPVAGGSAAPTSPVATGSIYIVQAGDTLTGIAARAGVSMWAIAQANSITNLQHIYVGQRLVIPGAQPAAAPRATPRQTTTTQAWRGEYYNNATLSDSACLVRSDAAINFHWGTGRPSTCLSTDLFSARWTKTLSFIGGVYRFTVRVDDGVRLYVDGNLVLDSWQVQPETDYQVDVEIAAGSHTLKVEYFEDTGIATMQFSFIRVGASSVCTPVATAVAASGAWYGEYFNGTGLSGTADATRTDGAIGFEWDTDAPMSGISSDYFSARWTRSAYFYSDNYSFCAMADDGVRIYLDGNLVLDEWHANNGVAYCGETNVTAGTHRVKVEYYEDGGDALIYVWYEQR